MENIFLKALNDISFEEIRNKIFIALSKVMIADEYNRLWIGMWDIYDTYFIYETHIGEEWVKFKVDYTKDENDEIIIDLEGKKQVERQDVYVEVNEVQQTTNAILEEKKTIEGELNNISIELNNIKDELLKEQEEKFNLNSTLETIMSENEKLKECEKQLNQIQYDEKLENTKLEYKEKFEKFNSLETFNSEKVQSLIADTLDSEKSLNATIEIKDILLDCASNNVPAIQSHNSANNVVIEQAKGFNMSMKPNKSFVEEYGFDING